MTIPTEQAEAMELLPCPFCGRIPEEVTARGNVSHGGDCILKLVCSVEDWNTRTTPPVEMVGAIRGILHRLGGPSAVGDWSLQAANEIASLSSLPDDRLRVAREALEAALGLLTEEGWASGPTGRKIAHAIATLGEPAQSGEVK